ncbi:MAG TPA: protein kinase, partial [Thermoanaerobaculia bacterium]|nr:protein kinase [Thermoanaerobaculia bacterium]
MIEKLGHYKIVSELGRGGMGVVYKAYEESLNRYVAIKVLGEHLSHDQSFVKRFVREAKAAAGLSHPNVIQIFYIGHEAPPAPNPNGQGERHYFVMEFVEGRSVHDVLEQDGAFDPMRATRIVQQAASGLAVAHDQGLVHRDIKPANLLVTRDERLKIADFGLALAPTDGATRLTATNSLMGTPGYLSPEQCCGEPAGPRSDIYSLGMTFYEMLTGSMPFKGESPLAVLRQILDEEPTPLLQIDPDLDPRIAGVVERMVAKEPNDRYQTCHLLIADLNEILGTRAAAVPTAGLDRAAALPPLPNAPNASARTQARVSGRPEDAPTQVAPAPLPRPGTGRMTTAPVAGPGGVVPPVPPAIQPIAAAAAVPPTPVAPPVVAAGAAPAAAAKSGKSGRL